MFERLKFSILYANEPLFVAELILATLALVFLADWIWS
jgi:hypothetical protein